MSYHFLNLIYAFFLTVGFVLVVSAVFGIILKHLQYERVGITNCIVAIVGIIVISGGFFAKVESQNVLNEKVNEGYIVYLDGREVEAETISFTQYNVSVNDEDETICLTQKRESRRYMPVIIPR